MQYLLLICIIVPLLIYLRVGLLKPRVDTHDPHKFFILPQMISPLEFANTSTAYGFQVASISVFLAWGYFYGFAALINPIFWGVGIFLFILSLPKLKPFLGEKITLHGFLGTKYKSNSIRILASLMTIFGFMGLLLAELVWGSQVLLAVIPNPTFMYFITFFLGIFIVVYLAKKGHLSIIRTDLYQLLFSYIGFIAILLWFLYRINKQNEISQTVGIILSLSLALIFWITWRSINRSKKTEEEREPIFIQNIISSIFIIATIVIFANILFNYQNFAQLPKTLQESNLFNLTLNKWSVLSLILLPLTWQFVDVTAWQRLSAVKISGENTKPIKIGLLRYAIESPLTWILAIILGIAVRYSGLEFTENEIWNMMVSLPTKLIALGAFEGFIAALFIIGILAIMLSTMDACLIGSVFTLVYDTIPKTRKILDSKSYSQEIGRKIIKIGIIASFIFVILGLSLYYILSARGIPILSILFGAYSAQISLVPTVLGILFLKNRIPSPGWVIASIILGFIGGMWATIISFSNVTWQLYPPLFSLGLSIPVFCVGILFSSRRRIINA